MFTNLSSAWLDSALLLMIVASVALGFTQGLLRQTVLLGSMYLGTVISAQYHGIVADFIKSVVKGSNPEVATIIAFVLVAVAFTLVSTVMFWRNYHGTRISVPMADEIGGAALGGVIGIFAVALTLMIANYALEIPWPEGSTIRYALHVGVNHGSIQTLLSAPFPLIQTALHPWLPDGVLTAIVG